MPLHLLPAPRSLTLDGGQVALPAALGVSGADDALLTVTLGARGRRAEPAQAQVHCRISADGGEGEEGYRLVISSGTPAVTITARTRTGLRWGLTTLAQIVAQSPKGVPTLRIEDAPLFPIRGAMLDISRDRVPTMATLQRLVQQLASWKLNHLELYTEHTFAYRGHEAVWFASSPMTAEEMRDLDRLCTAHGIALTANQNCLGHVERWLKVPQYAHLGERDRGQFVHGHWYQDQSTLIPSDPAGLALVKDLLDQLIPTCSGAYVHIGCDEPWDIGYGRSKDRVAKEGFHGVYAKHVSQVADYVRAHGRRPVYWSDADHAKPEIAALLPGDIVPLVWGYDGGTEFAKRGRLFRDLGLETWVAPGTNNWGSFNSRTAERRANLARAAREGSEIGCVGFLNTEWGDMGHRQQWPLTLMGFADGAQSGWTGDKGFDDDAMGLHAFGVPALGKWLADFGDADLAIRKAGISLFGDAHRTVFDPDRPGTAAEWQACDATLAKLESSLPACDPLVSAELKHAVALSRWACERALMRRSAEITVPARRAVAAKLCDMVFEHRRLWLERSRYGGLEQSTDHYRKIMQSW